MVNARVNESIDNFSLTKKIFTNFKLLYFNVITEDLHSKINFSGQMAGKIGDACKQITKCAKTVAPYFDGLIGPKNFLHASSVGFEKIARFIKKIGELFYRFISQNKPISFIAKSVPFWNLFKMPRTIYKMVTTGTKLAHGEKEERLSNSIKMAERVGELFDYSEVLLFGLQSLAVIVINNIAKIIFGIITALFSVLPLIREIKELVQTVQSYRMVKRLSGLAERAQLPEIICKLESLTFRQLKKLCQIEKGPLLEKLEEIAFNRPEEGAQTAAVLKGRIKQKIISHSLRIVQLFVNMLALGILMTPASAVAYGLLAIVSVLSLSNLIYKKVTLIKFRKQINITPIPRTVRINFRDLILPIKKLAQSILVKFKQNAFYNKAVVCEHASFLRKAGDLFNAPYQYLFNGKVISNIDLEQQSYEQSDRFTDDRHKVLKTILAIVALVPCVLASSICLGLDWVYSRRSRQVYSLISGSSTYVNMIPFDEYIA